MAHAQTDGLMPEGREPAGLPDSEMPTTDAVPAEKRRPPYDPDWLERIELAKRAREDGRKAREGKPIVFSIDYPPHFP